MQLKTLLSRLTLIRLGEPLLVQSRIAKAKPAGHSRGFPSRKLSTRARCAEPYKFSARTEKAIVARSSTCTANSFLLIILGGLFNIPPRLHTAPLVCCHRVGPQPVFPVGLLKKKFIYAYNFFHATRYYPESSALESPSKLPIFRMLTWVYLIFLMWLSRTVRKPIIAESRYSFGQ